MPYGADYSGNDHLFISEIIVCWKKMKTRLSMLMYCPIAINGIKSDGLSYYDKRDVELHFQLLEKLWRSIIAEMRLLTIFFRMILVSGRKKAHKLSWKATKPIVML